jgi:hypothetical protein
MYLFRKLKPWQVFVLLFMMPLIIQFGLSYIIAASQQSINELVTIALGALPVVVLTFWLWHTANYLYTHLPQSIKISSVFTHLAALYFLFYGILLIYTLNIAKESILLGHLPLGMLALLIPMHLFATFCYSYLSYFIARSVISIEQGRAVSFGEFASVLVNILFLPFGIWSLQNRIRLLLNTNC